MKARRAVAAAVAALSALAVTAVTAGPSGAVGTAKHPTAVTRTETITRTNLVAGTSHTVDKRTITLHVSQTTNLRGRQEVSVSWSGAHPTGGIIADQNSIDAQEEEYPFVLMECRGVDSTKVKAADRLSQQTCWTQDWSERYQDSYQTQFPPYRLDRYATKADRAQVVGAPKKLPKACTYLPAPTQHWVPFVAANGTVYDDGPAGCAGQPPESQSVGGSALPSNETFGVTGTDGKGTAKFDIWTSAENASLGCTQLVACTLVAVPIMGISCDPAAKGLPASDRPTGADETAAAAGCEAKGAFTPGQLVHPEGNEDLAVSGSLWWSASNWRNRISVPLTFAVPSNACDVVTSTNTVDVYGSELLIQATGQWAPHFCLNKKLFNITHVQTGEPQARNLVATGSADAAFVSDPQPGGYGKPVVNAPVAVTGFDIGYTIDGANGQPYKHLRLTPRLLAKLLTESYPAELPIKTEYAALANNPLNITLDPEFEKLNPGITKGVSASESAAALLTLSSDSDVVSALTSYINDDPTARAWLNGQPDPWGMVVNPAYKKIKLPVTKWPLLSTFEPKIFYAGDTNDCLHNSPVPYLPLVAAPMARLEEISESLQFSLAASTTACSQIDGTTVGEKLVPLGRQTAGFRFMIGLTSVADAARYQLSSAALQTTSPHTFVAPTTASLKAAAAFLKPDKSSGTWPVPYQTLRTAKAAAHAYPGTMVVYAAVPTDGLPAESAKDYSDFLKYVVTIGQKPGQAVGDLPPGYLPMTKANGLGAMAGYAFAAAGAIAGQRSVLPALTGHPAPTAADLSPPKTTGSHSSSPTPPATTEPPPSTSGGSTPTTPVPSDSSTPTPAASSTPASRPASTPVALGRTLGISLGGGSVAVLVVIGIALLGGIGAPATYLVGRRRGKW